jgi:hypothetical protein
MSKIRNNYDIYLALRDLPPAEQQAEYAKLAGQVDFKVKSLSYIIKKGTQLDDMLGGGGDA